MTRIFVPDHIENADAYVRAAELRIANNRRKGNAQRWIAESGQEVVELCRDFLFEEGQFAMIRVENEHGEFVRFNTNPLVKVSLGDFYSKMKFAVIDWGRLSPGQESAVLRMIEKAKARIAEREAAKEAKAASAQHIGTVGERRDFDLTLKFKTIYETRFGFTKIYVMEDDAGNVAVYKGSSYLTRENGDALETGDRVKFKATIKAHGERDGVKQTIISRPKVI
jgi:hypothetical protein